MEIIEIEFDKINVYLKENDSRNIIYGAGYNGKLLYQELKKRNISVIGFFDDDKTRWGENYCEKDIFSKEQFLKFGQNANIIISSIYVGQIIERLQNAGLKKIFTVKNWLLQNNIEVLKLYKYKENIEYLNKLDNLIEYFNDDLSKQYFLLIKKTIQEQKAVSRISDLYCGEKQYFLNYFSGKLNGLVFVDAGSYTGDTIQEMIRQNIEPGAVYCFEANQKNFSRLSQNKNIHQKIKNIYLENYALWNTETELKIKGENFNSKVDEEGEFSVKAITLDKYFENIKIDFIKMDIEGAEQKALSGGMKVIQRDRPILAISIYHTLEDIIDIPTFLSENLDKYSFFVRHHSYTYSETILYGIPREKQNKI